MLGLINDHQAPCTTFPAAALKGQPPEHPIQSTGPIGVVGFGMHKPDVTF